MDSKSDHETDFHTPRDLNQLDMERNKFIAVLQKDHERLKKKVFRKKKHRPVSGKMEVNFSEREIKSGQDQLDYQVALGQGNDESAHKLSKSTQKITVKRKIRKIRKRKSRLSPRPGRNSVETSEDMTEGGNKPSVSHRKSSNGCLVETNKVPRDFTVPPGLNRDSWITKLSDLDLDSGVSSDECDQANDDSLVDVSEVKSDTSHHVQGEVHAAICSVFDRDEFDVQSAEDLLESESHGRNSGNVSKHPKAQPVRKVKRRSKSSPTRRSHWNYRTPPRVQARVVPVVELFQSPAPPGNSLNVQGINMGTTLRAQQCWPGDVETVRRGDTSQKIVSNFLDRKPLSLVPTITPAQRQGRFTSPYPVYSKFTSSSNMNEVKGKTSTEPTVRKQTGNRPQSAQLPTAEFITNLPPEPPRRSPNLAPTRARPFSAPTRASPASTTTSQSTPSSLIRRQPYRPLRVDINTDDLEVRSRSATVQPRISSANSAKRASRTASSFVESSSTTDWPRAVSTSYTPRQLTDLDLGTFSRSFDTPRYVKPRCTPRLMTPEGSGDSDEEDTAPEFVMKVFVTPKQVENVN